MAMAGYALLGVGALESVCGLYHLLFPTAALPGIVGRFLSVGAVQSSPALVPMIAQAGALRLALGVIVLGYATGPMANSTAHKLEACVVAHTCLLQPFVATFRSHVRMPMGGASALSLLEGCALVLGMAVDADFEVGALLQSIYFLASLALLLLGLLFALLACCLHSSSKGSAVSTNDEEATTFKGSGQMPLFDENRHKLSPGAKRLLS